MSKSASRGGVILPCRGYIYLGRLRETAAPEMVFVRLGGPDFLRGSFAGSFAGVCARDSSFYSVAAVQSVRFEVGGPERAPPGASEEAFFRAFSIQDENKVMFFSRICCGVTF